MLLKSLSEQSGVSVARLAMIASTASRRYKIYRVRKKSGGTRVIHHPSRQLKAIQRWIIKSVLNELPIHYSATAYRKGASIVVNADRHRHTNYTTRYDFENFFPSFKQRRIEKFLLNQRSHLNIELSEDDAHFVGNIVCRNGSLTIGAPSSPVISNTMMFDFDRLFTHYCEERGIIYTRYADDIYVSSREGYSLNTTKDKIESLINNVEHLSLRLRGDKTAYLSRKYSRRITGIVITPDRNLSIGRARKREIRALIHRWLIGDLPADQMEYMRGMLAFAIGVEPNFRASLEEKYGRRSIRRIISNPQLNYEPAKKTS